MALTDAEKKIVADELVFQEGELIALVQAEVAKIPAPYGALVSAGLLALEPQVKAILDAKVQAIIAGL